MDDLLDLLKQMQDAPTAENGKRAMDSPCLRTGTASGCAVPPSVPGLTVTPESNTRIFCLPTGMPAITHSWMMENGIYYKMLETFSRPTRWDL